jgi:hypothetical protein
MAEECRCGMCIGISLLEMTEPLHTGLWEKEMATVRPEDDPDIAKLVWYYENQLKVLDIRNAVIEENNRYPEEP